MKRFVREEKQVFPCSNGDKKWEEKEQEPIVPLKIPELRIAYFEELDSNQNPTNKFTLHVIASENAKKVEIELFDAETKKTHSETSEMFEKKDAKRIFLFKSIKRQSKREYRNKSIQSIVAFDSEGKVIAKLPNLNLFFSKVKHDYQIEE